MQASSSQAAVTDVVVSVHNAFKSYGRIQALSDVTFDVHAGESVALLGPNGSGKTTTINIMLGLRRYDRGSVSVFGEPPLSAGARQSIGVLLQESGLPATVRVSEVLAYVASQYDNPVSSSTLVERFNLANVIRRQIGGLSGGERRRLSLTLAFVGNPKLVFLDEPTTGLDVESRRAVWDAIRQSSESGTTVFLTTHNLVEAETLTSRAMVISKGRLLTDSSMAAIRRSTNARQISFTSDVPPEGFSQMTRTGNRYTIVSDDPDTVVRELVRDNIPYRDLEVVVPSLEDIFLNIVEKSE